MLFDADPTSDAWQSYMEYVDEMVVEGLFGYIGQSLQFIVDNMDSCHKQVPLFEAHLMLTDLGMSFHPSLQRDAKDGFYELVAGLVGDIFKVSVNINKLSADLSLDNYQVLTFIGF